MRGSFCTHHCTLCSETSKLEVSLKDLNFDLNVRVLGRLFDMPMYNAMLYIDAMLPSLRILQKRERIYTLPEWTAIRDCASSRRPVVCSRLYEGQARLESPVAISSGDTIRAAFQLCAQGEIQARPLQPAAFKTQLFLRGACTSPSHCWSSCISHARKKTPPGC